MGATAQSGDVLGNLASAIGQSFLLIFMGYLSGRFSVISRSQAKGLGVYVTKFALPAVLFKSMSELDFSVVNWYFLLSVFIGKGSIYFFIVVLTALIVKPLHFGKMGIYGLFCTQSNDVALGIPILQVLYGSTHPEYINYIYLIAPLQIAIINTISFLLLELQKARRGRPNEERHTMTQIMWTVVKGVALNPIVYMTIFGLVSNFIFKRQLPYFIAQFLQVLERVYDMVIMYLLGLWASGRSISPNHMKTVSWMICVKIFAATALFYVGVGMTENMNSRKERDWSLLLPALLVGTKVVLLPIVISLTVSTLDVGATRNETMSLAVYGNLYGTFPPAPVIFSFASMYKVQSDMVGTGILICTFLSAPLMFVSAQMVNLLSSTEAQYRNLVSQVSEYTSISGLIASILVLLVFVVSKRIKSVPHQFTLAVVVCQMCTYLAMILWSDKKNY